MSEYCPQCDHKLVADEPEEGIVRERCSVCPFERETEVDDGFWV